ncbi:uncharacterized protein FOBCDRAFT_200961 [Fusarium oxysporum Fo47]|uniref:uncharacterized protein n=1 Tax=Fusarium oxysporum Fo47 TaxID=660027 RepID=UPI002869C153|nr:uncharacterized protein FOBCDRAFT_200961 [Fusarium oxysporum Fo47]WJG35239.1 hypothetical protein FOBCDRAFT_200961 [Fusarium oxysporum Fo47]
MCCGGRSDKKPKPMGGGAVMAAPSKRTSSCRKSATARQTSRTLQSAVTHARIQRTPSPRLNNWLQANEDRSFNFSLYGSSNGFRKGKSKQTASMGSDTSKRGINGSFESFQGNSWR